MTEKDRDRLVALQKAKKRLITQKAAAEEIGQSERHVRRLLKKLKGKGDAVVVHGLRGRRSNRQIDEKVKQAAIKILSNQVYVGFGPTLAAEYLADKHDIRAGRETVRGWMVEGKLWRPKRQRIEKIHEWRQRRSRAGELVQWDTSEHAWLEDRGPKLYLIGMIDDATSRIHARFVLHDSTEENMRLLWSYLERNGRPLSFYADKASLSGRAEDAARPQGAATGGTGSAASDADRPGTSGTGYVWIAAHSPQAKGRVERSFQTAQDRLVKGLRVAGASTLEQANAYLEEKFIPWWNQKLTVVSAEEYSMLLQVDTLMVRQESNNTQADLADLRGARFVQTSETEEGQCLAQGKLKTRTGQMLSLWSPASKLPMFGTLRYSPAKSSTDWSESVFYFRDNWFGTRGAPF